MNKIGILTYHNNNNKGAILQAYCLRKTVSALFPCVKVEVIDYRPLAKEMQRYYDCLKPSQFKHTFLDFILCEKFLRNNLNLSKEKIVTNNYHKAVSWLKEQSYEILIVGSDEVWKIQKKNTTHSRLFARPFPNLYFLDPSISGTKVSYGATFGKTDVNLLSFPQRKFLKRNLSSFDYKSVRDSYSKNILRDLDINDVYLVPDPTLLCDISSLTIDNKLKDTGVDFSKPLLGVHSIQNPSHPIFKKICNKFRAKGFQIISPDYLPFADFNFRGKLSPLEYYSIHKYFDIMVTSSLHSTIFSLKQGTPFLTIDPSPIHNLLTSKTYHLLGNLSLLNRYVSTSDVSILKNIDCYLEPLNQEEVAKQINALKQNGLQFLSLALKNVLNG